MVRISDIQNGEVLWDTVPFCNINNPDIPTYELKKNDILFARTGGTVGKSFLVSGIPYTNVIYAGYLIRTRYSSLLNPNYLKMFMESKLYWDQLRDGTTATAQPNCNGQTLGKMLIPIPPISEQIRIIKYLNEIQPLIDEYSIKEKISNSIQRAFPNQLKKSILQEAIQGKLVPQDPNDEPASVLLERIRKEKEELIKQGKIKKEKNESIIYRRDNSYYEKLNGSEVCIDGQLPFTIPESWFWVRHNDLFEIVGGSQPPKSHFVNEKKDNYVRLYQIRDYGEAPMPVYVPKDEVSKFTEKNDILLARYGGSLGKVFWAENGAYNVAMAKSTPLYKTELISKQFIFLYYLAPLYQNLVKGNSNARSAQGGFNKDDLNSLFFPLPPHNEQLRIVEKVKKLSSIINAISTNQ